MTLTLDSYPEMPPRTLLSIVRPPHIVPSRNSPAFTPPYRFRRQPYASFRQPSQRPSPSYYSRFPLNQTRSPPHHDQPPPKYTRFNRINDLRRLWRTNPQFRIGVLVIAVGGGAFYVVNLERVPVSGRLRFNCVPQAWEERMGAQILEETIRQYQGRILPSQHPISRLTTRVMERLLPVSGASEGPWTVVVIDDPEQANAFVLPG